jgi:hypothetical protein
VEGDDWPWPVRHYSTSFSWPASSVENGRVLVYCAGVKGSFLIKKDGSNSWTFFFCEVLFSQRIICIVPRSFPNDTVQNKTSYSIITKSEETDSVCDWKHNRRRTVLNDDTLEDVRLSLLQSPSKLLRKLSQQKNTSLGSAQKVVHLLHLRAYRIHVMHELISKGMWPPLGLQTYLHQISFCGAISKNSDYDSNPHTIKDLKTNISEANASINHRTLRRVA